MDTATPFSAELRAATRKEHERAERTGYMEALLGERLDLGAYTRLAEQYYFIYGALEERADALADDPVASRFTEPELRRVPALEQDLAHLIGPDWRSRIAPVPATESYVLRIREAGRWSGGFVAHHYTRYLGDVAGGQVVRRLLAQRYGLVDAGAAFYRFDVVGGLPGFRKRYRDSLDTAGWGQVERERVIVETCVAFECNVAVFNALASELDLGSAA
ncbi:heme oxygenase (biliverdin-producing) [Actinosynnema sp.]|uniref:biliverdin-producing heme oxygenase n=1 Tax=Actinosynnema sp. TaxID=1872144 RepID=UPI003F84EF79